MSRRTQSSAHHRQELNNFLQHRFRTTRDLQLVDSSTGPPHAMWWTVVVFFRGVEYGRGEGSTKAAATELASQRALHALRQPGTGH